MLADVAAPKLAQGSNALRITVSKGKSQKRRSTGAPTLATANEEDAVRLLQIASQVIGSLLQWESQLKSALLDDAPIKELVRLGHAFIDTHYALIDSTLLIAASSIGYAEWIYSLGYDPSGEDDQDQSVRMDPYAAGLLLSGAHYHAAAEHEEPFYYIQPAPADAPGSERPFFVINHFIDGAFAARLVAGAPDGIRELSQGEEQFLVRFAPYLFKCFERNVPAIAIRKEASARMRELLAMSASAAAALDEQALSQSFAAYGWHLHDEYVVAYVQFPDEANSKTVASYVARTLEELQAESCAATAGENVIWLVDLRASGISDCNEVIGALERVLQRHACRVGISAPCDNQRDLHTACRQAQAAIVWAKSIGGKAAYAYFPDHAFGYLLSHATGEFDARTLAHKGLLALQEYDAAHGTEYVKTLACFLVNKCNATHTAEQLFIHRSSLLKRIERIRRIADIDFDDADEGLHIMLSLKLLEIDA